MYAYGLTDSSASTNLRKGGFWFIAYLLFDPALLAAVQREIAPAFTGAEIDQDYLTKQCPRFQGAWEETMRITAFSSSVRFVTQDTVVGNKLLRKGYRIMMPYRQMHLDESVFGDNVQDFVPERFVKNPNLRKHNMTFGGGATQCPGRHLATHSILVFVAMFLHKFDVTLDPPGQAFPVINEAHPVLGLVDVRRESDLKVRLKLR
jgi:cytochrome P450